LRISVDHLTEYRYAQPVGFGEHSLYLRPRESQTLHVASFSLDCEPSGRLRWLRDCFNNIVAVLSFGPVTSEVLSLRCRMAFDVSEENPFDFILESRATRFPFAYDDREKSALRPFLQPEESERWPVLDWARTALGDHVRGSDTVELLTHLNKAIYGGIAYEERHEEGVQPPSQTLELGRGSCRDMAELFVATARQLGLAARFVSGYLYEPPPPAGQPAFNRAAGSMHAWAEVYLPGAGWRGFDPTNGILTDHYFVTAAVANEPQWVNPVQGKYLHASKVDSTMQVELAIEGSAE